MKDVFQFTTTSATVLHEPKSNGPGIGYFDMWALLTENVEFAFLALGMFVFGAFMLGARKRAESDFNSLGGFFIGAVLFRPLKLLRGQVYLSLPAYDYATRNLKDPRSKYLRVPSRDDIAIETDQTFVTLKLEGDDHEHDHTTILGTTNRLRFIGDPGSGKSTIVKRLFRDQCRLLANWRTAHLALFPIAIDLRDLRLPDEPEKMNKAQWLLDAIKQKVKQVSTYEIEGCFDHFLNKRGVLVLLDGADEINTANFEFIASAINDFSDLLTATSEKNAIVLTMRSQFHVYARDVFQAHFPKVLTVKPFSPSDIYSLLTRWPFKANHSQHASRIYADLSHRTSLRELCFNPLVLSMYVAEDQRRSKGSNETLEYVTIPDSRTDFYSDVITELVIKRRESQKGAITGRMNVQRQRELFFGMLCFRHLMDSAQAANSIPFDLVVTVANDVLAGKPQGENEESIVEFVRELSKDTGLFTEERDHETVRFIHLSIIEYFAAFYAIRHNPAGWVEIVQRHKENKDTRIRELFPFAVFLSAEHTRAGQLADVLNELNDDLLTASCFIECKMYDAPIWIEFANQLQALIGDEYLALESEESASRFYTFVSVLRDSEANGYEPLKRGASTIDQILERTISRDDQKSLKVIQLMARFDAVAALRLADLCGINLFGSAPNFVSRNCEQPAFLGQVLERSNSSRSDASQWLIAASRAACTIPAARDHLAARGSELVSHEKEQRTWEKAIDQKRSLLTDIFSRTTKLVSGDSLSASNLSELNTSDFKLYIFHMDALRFIRNGSQKFLFREAMLAALVTIVLLIATPLGISSSLELSKNYLDYSSFLELWKKTSVIFVAFAVFTAYFYTFLFYYRYRSIIFLKPYQQAIVELRIASYFQLSFDSTWVSNITKYLRCGDIIYLIQMSLKDPILMNKMCAELNIREDIVHGFTHNTTSEFSKAKFEVLSRDDKRKQALLYSIFYLKR